MVFQRNKLSAILFSKAIHNTYQWLAPFLLYTEIQSINVPLLSKASFTSHLSLDRKNYKDKDKSKGTQL
jgi:hypothetical protein